MLQVPRRWPARLSVVDTAEMQAAKSRLRILEPGKTCWRIAEAGRAAILIDSESYYAALEDTLAQAGRSIIIVGWDFDGDIALRPGKSLLKLGPYLRSLVEAKPELEIRILIWSMAVVHAAGAPIPLLTGLGWPDHPRIQLRLDTEHPIYAAHHQKIVCIDDRLAFVGGIDLTVGRWDTSGHVAHDRRRRNTDGVSYGPLHDSQMMVDGVAAQTISELAGRRWLTATRQRLECSAIEGDVWPVGMTPDFRNIDVAISRTAPSWRGKSGIREGQACTEALLRAARKSIFIEQQYLTVMAFGRIIAHTLERPKGPEIVLIVNDKLDGSAERIYMGGNRDRLLAQLKRADRFGRLRVVHPVVPDTGGDCMVKVHAKLIIIDDTYLRIGSSNLNYRSTGLDTECDLTIEAVAEHDRAKIAAIRNRLLAEHLDRTVEAVARSVAETGSLVETLDQLSGGPRSLRHYHFPHQGITSRRVWGTFLIDPSRPLKFMAPLRQLALRAVSAGRPPR